jgi:DnaJ-like protein
VAGSGRYWSGYDGADDGRAETTVTDKAESEAWARIRKRAAEAERELEEALRLAHEQGELRHLYGKPLDLSDDSPEWLVNRTLKQAGFSHPALERGKELDAAQPEADALLERLRRRRSWLAGPQSRCIPEQAAAFNDLRQRTLEAYGEKLNQLNRDIRDYNLGAPASLHRRHIDVQQAVARAGLEIPPLDVTVPADPPASSGSGLRGALRRLRGAGSR